MFGWFAGILGVFFSWLTLNFLGKPFLEFRKVRQEIQEELTYLSNVDPPSQTTLYEGTEEDYAEEVKIFYDARRTMRRLGSKTSALSLDWPLPYILHIFGYDLDKATKNLLHLSSEFESAKRTLSRYYVESALRLPHAEEWWAKKLIEDRKREREAAEQRRKADADQ
jgi:hypothetical protein